MGDFDYRGRRDELLRQLGQARRDRESPVFTSSEEFGIEQDIQTLDMQHNRRMGYNDTPRNAGPLGRLPDVDM